MAFFNIAMLLVTAFVSVPAKETEPTPTHAIPAEGNPRLEKLFQSFIAPCCWRENLLVHHSPRAGGLRAEIKRFVAEGRSDDQIKSALIKQYSIRILSMPEGSRGQWLSWTPPVAVTAGFCVVVLTIRRLKRPASATPAGDFHPVPDSDWDWDLSPAPDESGEGKPA